MNTYILCRDKENQGKREEDIKQLQTQVAALTKEKEELLSQTYDFS